MTESMSAALSAAQARVGDPRALRLAFAHACAERVRHLLEDPGVIAGLDVLGRVVRGELGDAERASAAGTVAALAHSHPGSRSLDGVGHAAVSASGAVAHALAGRALQAADYAAYAIVYGEGGYGATSDPASFEPERAWQRERLQALVAAAMAEDARRARVAACWQAFVDTLLPNDPRRSAQPDAFAFGGGGALADELAARVLAGRKRATASLPVEFEATGDPLPSAGDLSLILDGHGEPVAIIERTQVDHVRFADVDDAFAACEGEGDGSLAYWRAAHTDYFGGVCARLGGQFGPDTPIICQRFVRRWPVSDA